MSDRNTGTVTSVPFAQPDIDEDDIAAVTGVLRRGWITTGEECARLEAELSAYLGGPHVVSTSSCTAALETSFAYLGLRPGARVGVPTWTFAASAHAPARHGAIPVLLDSEPSSLNLSPEAVEAAIAEGIDALVVVLFAGLPVDRRVYDLCAEAQVPVVEDLAHGLGASDHRGRASALGTVAGCLSFYATKNLTSAEGGAVVTHDENLARFARTYRLHGLTNDAWHRRRPVEDRGYDVVLPGMKANLPDVLAALARSQLVRFDDMQARRRSVELRYRQNLSDVEGLRFVPEGFDDRSAHHLCVVVLPEGVARSAVAQHLAEAGIGTSIHFRPLHRMSWFREHAEVGPGGVAVADLMAPRTLSLPQYPGLSTATVDQVSAVLREALAV